MNPLFCLLPLTATKFIIIQLRTILIVHGEVVFRFARVSKLSSSD